MTESSLQTRCPECGTRFQVNDEQLSIAKGKVRCGKCMAVFNAIDHQVSDNPEPTETHQRQPETSAEPDPAASAVDQEKPERNTASGFSSDDDFVFADNPEEDAAEGQYQGSSLTFSEDELSDSFLSLHEGNRDKGFHDEDDTGASENVDESWAEAMLEEETGESLTDDDTPEPKPWPEAESPAEPAPPPPEEIPKPDLPVQANTTGPEQQDEKPEPPPQSQHWTLEGDAPETEPLTAQSSTPSLGEHAEGAASPWSGLQRDPVPAYRRHHNRGRFRTALWTLVILAMLGALVSQVVWFQFDRLSAIPEFRPFYEKGCELAGCELAPLVQLNKIQSRKLVVRTDPDNRNRLLVDAEIVNEAEFEQPFPAIALTFSNLNGDVVAQSVFSPDEYLAGDGKQLSSMPTGTRVRIAISIRDPGRDAVNYNMAFRRNPDLR